MRWTTFKRERRICQVLKSLVGQRVVSLLQPGNVWVIENAPYIPGKDEAISTCLMRGWVEVLQNAVPKGQLGTDCLPERIDPFKEQGMIYRITGSDWAVINRTHT